MDCTKVQNMMSLYMDDQLAADEKKLFEKHIASCENCKKELDFMQEIMNNVSDLDEEKELPTNFHKNLMVKIDSINSTRTQTTNKVLRINNLRRYYTAAAAVFVIVLVFGYIGISNLNNYTNDEYMPKESQYEADTATKEDVAESAPNLNKSVTYDNDSSKALGSSKTEETQSKENGKSRFGTATKSDDTATKMSSNEAKGVDTNDNKADTLEPYQMMDTTEEDNTTDTTDTDGVADELNSDIQVKNIKSKDVNNFTVQSNEYKVTLTGENKLESTTEIPNEEKEKGKEDVQQSKENKNGWMIGSIIVIALFSILLILLIVKKLRKR